MKKRREFSKWPLIGLWNENEIFHMKAKRHYEGYQMSNPRFLRASERNEIWSTKAITWGGLRPSQKLLSFPFPSLSPKTISRALSSSLSVVIPVVNKRRWILVKLFSLLEGNRKCAFVAGGGTLEKGKNCPDMFRAPLKKNFCHHQPDARTVLQDACERRVQIEGGNEFFRFIRNVNLPNRIWNGRLWTQIRLILGNCETPARDDDVLETALQSSPDDAHATTNSWTWWIVLDESLISSSCAEGEMARIPFAAIQQAPAQSEISTHVQ